MKFVSLLKLVLLGVTLPLCIWTVSRNLSAQKPRHNTTSTATVSSLFEEKRGNDSEKEKKALLEGAEEKESQDLFRIAEEDETTILNDNGAQYRDCNWARCWIDELNDLIEGSDKISRLIESRVDTMRRLGMAQAHLESDCYNALQRERHFRETALAEIDRVLLDIVTKYPEIQMTRIENKGSSMENGASSSNLGESGSLLCSDELFDLQRRHTISIKKARAESAKRALHERRIMKRFLASSSRAPRIPESSTTIPESEPHETALLAEVPQANWIQDEEPMETPIEVKAWALTKELILAKSKLIYASCEKSCTLETTRAEMEMRGAPQSELDSVYLEIDKEKQVRQTTFHEMESFLRKKALLEHTHPVVIDHLEQGHGTALDLYNAENKKVWEKLCKLESINKEIRQTTAPVTSDSESEPNQNARLAEVREPNEDADPIETPIEVQAWALAQELIRAKRKLIHASCEKSCTLESTYAKMCGAPQSQVDPVFFEIEKEKQVRKTTFDAIVSVSRQMTSFEDTYPLVREKRRLEHGYGTALALDKDEKKQNRLLWQKLGKLESQNRKNTAITRTTAPSNSQTLRIGD